MLAGESPQQIIDWLVANDAQGNPSSRQYGIVDFRNSKPRAAAYTGVNCMSYKNDTAGFFYSIQGNILLGQPIIDSMQTRFLSTQGTLADRLMAALQGAKVIGADTRCAPRNSSSLSAFLRVANPLNQPDSLYLDLWMAYPQGFSGIVPVDPIDSLQTLYNQWKTIMTMFETGIGPTNWVKVLTTPGGETALDFSACPDFTKLRLVIVDLTGRTIYSNEVSAACVHPFSLAKAGAGIYIFMICLQDNTIVARGKLFNNTAR